MSLRYNAGTDSFSDPSAPTTLEGQNPLPSRLSAFRSKVQ